MRRPRVFGPVDAVTEPHYFLALPQPGEDLSHGRGGRVAAAAVPDLRKASHHLLVGTAMQWPLERAERGDHRGMHVGERRRTDPGGECRRVHRVVGVQHQAGVKDPRFPLGWRRPGDLQQEVSRQAGFRIGRRAFAPSPRGVVGRHQNRLRSEEHTSELQSPYDLVCRLLLEKKKKTKHKSKYIKKNTKKKEKNKYDMI